MIISFSVMVYWYFASTESYNYFEENNFPLLFTVSILIAPFFVFTQRVGEGKQSTFITDLSIWNVLIWSVVIVYQFFKRTDDYTYFNQENLGNLFILSLVLSLIFTVIGKISKHRSQNPTPKNERIRWRDPEQKGPVKKGSSKTAKG